MSRNGSGTYNLPGSVNPVVTGTSITSDWANTTLNDIASALTGSIAADGQTPMTGNLNANSHKIVNLVAGSASGNSVEYDQFIEATSTNVVITGGTINDTSIGATTPSTGKFTTLETTGYATFGTNGEFNGTGALKVPSGTTVQQPGTPIDGMIRYNTTTGNFEGYIDGAWGAIGGGATGGGGDEVFVENARVVTTNYTLSTGKSAESVGPITINSGVSVTIPSDERWVIL